MNGSIEDKEFDEYLGRKSQVSRLYRELDEADVPAHVDDAILAKARSAVPPTDELARVRNRRQRLMQWGIPATLAACSLLVVSIVIRSGTQHEIVPAQMMKAEAPSTPPQVEAKPKPDPLADETQGLVLIAPPRDAVTEFSSLAPPPAADSARADREREGRERASAGSIAAAAQRTQEQLRRSPVEVSEPDQLVSAIATTSVAAPSSPPVPAAVAAPAPPVSASGSPEQKMAAERSLAQSRSEESRREEASSSESDDLAEIAVTGNRVANQVRSGPRATVGASAGGMSAEQWEKEQLRAAPEKWLEHIRQLRRDAKPVAADREWREFRKQYPDYAVAETDLVRGR